MIHKRCLFFLLLLLNNFNLLFAQVSEWTRIAKPGYEKYAPVTLANGIYGITVSERALDGNVLQLSGIFDFHPSKGLECAIKGIDFTHLNLTVKNSKDKNGKGFRFSDTKLEELKEWNQQFNFNEGWLQTSFVFEGLHVDHTLFTLKTMGQTGIVKLTFTAQEDLQFELQNVLKIANPYEMTGARFTPKLRMREVPIMTATANSPTGKYKISASTSFWFEKEDKPALKFIEDNKAAPCLAFEHTLKKGESMTCYLIGSVVTSYTYNDPTNESARLNIFTYLKEPELVIEEHKQSWKKFWNKTDIVVEGDPVVTKDIRQMMFFINSFVRPGTDFSSACMGLGEDYWGHRTLWDADFWIYPALLLINPDAARSMLEHRWKRLEMAKKNAAAHGYQGAMFPWESASTGEEQTPIQYLTGPFQHHITSDVGLAFWRYYCVTQDKKWLEDRGYPMLKEVADFWVSRAEKNANGQYEIKNVVSSDEHAINVDNDAFTNAAAKSVLEAASKAAVLVGELGNEEWSLMAEGLIFTKMKNGVSKEHDSYDGEMIKQAATNLASFPLDVITDKDQITKNLDYYEQRIDKDGPNMTWPMYTGAAARAGDPVKALYFYEKAVEPYKKGPFEILSLRPYTLNTFFGTSGGGILQAFIMGFGGLHFTENGLVQKDPVLPKGWKLIKMKGIGSGQDFEVR